VNGYERYHAMLRGGRPDFVPRVPILMRLAAEYLGVGYGAFCTDHAVKTEANLACAEAFGLDVVGVMSDPYHETAGFGGRIEFDDEATPSCLVPPLAESRDLDALPRPDPRQAPRMSEAIATVRAYREAQRRGGA